jgi:stearoyl-CoA desaturase (delta-9 desaturase)
MKNLFASSTQGAQLFLLLSTMSSITGIWWFGITLEAALLIVAGYFVYGCLGIVVTFHRKLTHDSYQTHPLITKIFALFGCLGGTGSPLAWVAIHINHHLKSDKPGDPHSPRHKGFKIFALDYENQISKDTKWRMRSIITDRYYQFLHRYYFLIYVSWSLILYAIGGVWLAIFLHLVPATITALMSNMVNYVGHKSNLLGGFRTYKLADDSTNNWLFALPSWGESWHNNHHRHPKNYSLGEQWWQLDISALVIKLIRQ